MAWNETVDIDVTISDDSKQHLTTTKHEGLNTQTNDRMCTMKKRLTNDRTHARIT